MGNVFGQVNSRQPINTWYPSAEFAIPLPHWRRRAARLGARSVTRLFLSYSSDNSAQAVALRDWLNREGWDDVFLDPEPGTASRMHWERALNQASHRCEAVLFVVSRGWLASDRCLKEFNLAYRLS